MEVLMEDRTAAEVEIRSPNWMRLPAQSLSPYWPGSLVSQQSVAVGGTGNSWYLTPIPETSSD